MAFNLTSIQTSTADRPPRIILCGVPKIGKSTFAAGADAPIFLPIRGEEGIDDLAVPHFPAIGSFDDLLEALGTLATEQHEYKTLIIDSISTLQPLVWAAVCAQEKAANIEKVDGGFGKGYIRALDYWTQIRDALDYLRTERGMACVLIGHVIVKTFSDPTGESYDQYQLDLQARASEMFTRWADSILFANSKALVRTEKEGTTKSTKKATVREERCLFTQKRPAHPGGGRGVYGRLPYELPLEWAAFMEAITATATSK